MMMSASNSPALSAIFQCFPAQWSEACESRSAVAEKFTGTFGCMPAYIKHVGAVVDLAFINNFDLAQQHKKRFETQIGKKVRV